MSRTVSLKKAGGIFGGGLQYEDQQGSTLSKPALVEKAGMRKGRFSRILVVFCICVVIAYTLWAVLEFRRSGLEATTLTTAVYGFFGTELALLCLKRIFAKAEKKEGEKDENLD